MATSGIPLQELGKALKNIPSPGKFAVGVKIEHLDLPYVEVDGVGLFKLPLCLEDVGLLMDHCEPAPYGRGMDTVVDTHVRQASQIDGSRIKLPSMEGDIQKLAENAARNLGINTDSVKIRLSLYKLVLYKKGGHFLKHRDTEKEPGMFGTMVLQCPVAGGHVGAEFFIWHKDQQESFDFSEDSSQAFFLTAFFADCEHELKMIRSGYRVCLIFNLLRDQKDTSELLPLLSLDISNLSAASPLVEAALEAWNDPTAIKALPPKVAVLLEHKYTEKNLSFSTLKGRDRVIAEVLRFVRDVEGKPMLEVHLAILTKWEYGTVDDTPTRRRCYRGTRVELPHYIMEDVIDASTKLKNWIAVDDTSVKIEELDINEDTELAPPGNPFERARPDDELYEEYTGNEGPSLEYWYHAGVLVIWPHSKTLGILQEIGKLPAMLDFLERKYRERSPAVLEMLCYTLKYLEESPSRAYGSASARLMQLAIDLNSEASAVKLLNICAQPCGFPKELTGFLGDGFAKTIATAVRTFSWGVLCEHVLNLVTSQTITSQLDKLVDFYDCIKDFDKAVALQVAQKVFHELPGAATSPTVFQGKWPLLVSMLLKVIGPVEIDVSAVKPLLAGLKTRELNDILSMASAVFHQLMELPSETKKVELLKEISRLMVGKQLTRGDDKIIVDMVNNVCRLGDDVSVRGLHLKILHSPHCGQLLNTLFSKIRVFNRDPRPTSARSFVRRLICDRIAQVENLQPPTISWHMPKAEFPGTPAVEAFLKGPDTEFICQGFSGITEARAFASKNFKGSYQNGYSAVGTPGGRGSKAYCKICKTRAAFEALENEYSNRQEELNTLRKMLTKLPVDQHVVVVASEATITTALTPADDATSASTCSTTDDIVLD